MPNWCSNTLEIEASPKQLVEDWWLIDITDRSKDTYWVSTYIFNLHKILPEYYTKPYEEKDFDDQWDYDKNVDLTWSKWNFEMEVTDNSDKFYSSFGTARSPPDKLLKKFWRLSNISFNLHYEEPWCDFEWDLDFYNWSFFEDQYDYILVCDYCNEKNDEAKYIDDIW